MNEFLAFIFGMPFVILAIYFCYAIVRVILSLAIWLEAKAKSEQQKGE